MLDINWKNVLPSSAPQVKLHCSGEGRFRGVAVSVESGSDSLMVSGDGEAGELRHLLRRAGWQLMQEFPFRTQTQFVHVPDLLHRQQLIPDRTHGYG